VGHVDGVIDGVDQGQSERWAIGDGRSLGDALDEAMESGYVKRDLSRVAQWSASRARIRGGGRKAGSHGVIDGEHEPGAGDGQAPTEGDEAGCQD